MFETALIVRVPEAEAHVAAPRGRFDASAHLAVPSLSAVPGWVPAPAYDPAPRDRRLSACFDHIEENDITASTTAVKTEAKKRAPNPAFAKPMNLSAALTAVIGSGPAPRTEVTKRIWDYIKAHKLQDAENRRLINADDKLFAVFDKRQVTMFEMTKLVNAHLS